MEGVDLLEHFEGLLLVQVAFLGSVELIEFVFKILISFLGQRLFSGTIEGVQYFNTYIYSCFNMLVLLTTANFPDIMLPAYEKSRAASLFFIAYLLLGVF